MDNGHEYRKHWTRLDKEKDKELNQLTRITQEQEQEHTTQTNVKTSKTQSLNEAQIEIEINC